MAVENVAQFFETNLPERLNGNPQLADQVGAIYKFVVEGDGGGTWRVDLTSSPEALPLVTVKRTAPSPFRRKTFSTSSMACLMRKWLSWAVSCALRAIWPWRSSLVPFLANSSTSRGDPVSPSDTPLKRRSTVFVSSTFPDTFQAP